MYTYTWHSRAFRLKSRWRIPFVWIYFLRLLARDDLERMMGVEPTA